MMHWYYVSVFYHASQTGFAMMRKSIDFGSKFEPVDTMVSALAMRYPRTADLAQSPHQGAILGYTGPLMVLAGPLMVLAGAKPSPKHLSFVGFCGFPGTLHFLCVARSGYS